MQIIQDLDVVFLQILNVQTLVSCDKFNMGTEKGLFADIACWIEKLMLHRNCIYHDHILSAIATIYVCINILTTIMCKVVCCKIDF